MKVTHNSDGDYTIKCTKAELDILAGALSVSALYDSLVSNGKTLCDVHWTGDTTTRLMFGNWSRRNEEACRTIERATGKYSHEPSLPRKNSIHVKLGGPGQND